MIPKLGDAKVDKLLSQFSQMYRNNNYISEMILLPLKVKEKTGKFAKYGKENLRVYTDQIYRAPGTRAHSIDYSVSQGSYICKERSLEKGVPDEFINNTDDPYDPYRDATTVIMDNLWVNQEAALATIMADTGILTLNTTLSGTSQWSDYVNSDPIGNIETAIEAVRTATGQKPNVMVMGHSVFSKLKYHPDIREQAKYTGNGRLSDDAFKQLLKEFFSIEEVLVGDAIKNTTDSGQSDTLADIWGKHLWVLYRTPAPTLMKATFGMTLQDTPRLIERYREEEKVQDVIRLRYSYDQNIMDENLAYLIKNAIA